jgi:hypothetical protein
VDWTNPVDFTVLVVSIPLLLAELRALDAASRRHHAWSLNDVRPLFLPACEAGFGAVVPELPGIVGSSLAKWGGRVVSLGGDSGALQLLRCSIAASHPQTIFIINPVAIVFADFSAVGAVDALGVLGGPAHQLILFGDVVDIILQVGHCQALWLRISMKLPPCFTITRTIVNFSPNDPPIQIPGIALSYIPASTYATVSDVNGSH